MRFEIGRHAGDRVREVAGADVLERPSFAPSEMLVPRQCVPIVFRRQANAMGALRGARAAGVNRRARLSTKIFSVAGQVWRLSARLRSANIRVHFE